MLENRDLFVAPTKKNQIKIDKVVICATKSKAPKIERSLSPKFRFERTSNHTDIKVMKFL